MARIYKRPENPMVWGNSTQERIALSRNYQVTHLLCKLELTHTNGASPVFNDDGLFSAINKLEIVGNGNKNIKSIKGTKLALNTVLGTSTESKHTLDDTASTADLKSFVWFMIPFNVLGTIRPHDTILNTSLYSNLDLLIDWSNAAALGTDITITSGKLNIISNALINYKRNATETIKYFKETQTVEPIVNTADEHTITLPTQKIYKTISLVSTVDGARNDTVIENIILKSGTTVILNIPYDALQIENDMQFKPMNSNFLKGVAIIDFSQRGFLSDCLDTFPAQFNTLELVLKVKKLGTKTDVAIFTDEIENTSILEK